jgi:Flp pilus assembly protein TadD
VALVVGLAALAVFAPALGNGFVDWDDIANFVDNPHYRGLGPAHLRWMATATLTGHWIPVTWLTLGLDHVLWGMDPFGYHLTNVVLHAVGAALFCLVARALLGRAAPGLGAGALRLGAAVAALFFALHPLRAESVAWITERRDVLAGVFLFATLLAYVRASGSRGGRRVLWHGAALASYALALGAKAIVLTLPAILVVLDVYPLRRLGAARTRGVWLEKIPYLLLAAGAGAMALWALHDARGLTSPGHHPLAMRLALALYGFAFYLRKTLVPAGLSPLYELPAGVSLLDPPFLASAVAVVATSAVVWALRRRWPAGLAAWIVHCVVLLPVSIRVHAGHQLVTDRYSYLACLGWALALGGAAAALAGGASRLVGPAVGRVALAAVGLWVVALAAGTVQQVQVWRDPETLWRHALEVDRDCATCYNHLGAALGRRGELGPAIDSFQRGLALRPGHGALTLNLVDALMLAGRWPEAVARLEPALARFPNDNELRGRLAAALVNDGRREAAAAHVGRMMQARPTSPDALLNLGLTLVMLERPGEAIPYLQHVVRSIPLRAEAHFWLARAHLAAGDAAGARAAIEALRRLDPRLAERLA